MNKPVSKSIEKIAYLTGLSEEQLSPRLVSEKALATLKQKTLMKIKKSKTQPENKSKISLMQKQKLKKQAFRGNLIDGYIKEKTYPQCLLILKDRQECQHKNGISIKIFK